MNSSELGLGEPDFGQPDFDEPAEVPVLLVLGTGRRQFREYILASLAEQALVVAVDTRTPSWQSGYTEEFAVCAPDVQSQLAAGRELARNHRVDGVVSLDERFAESAALLAEELGLPTPGTAAVRTCLDRWQTRLLLNDAGVGTVRARLAATAGAAERAVRELGLPAVLRARYHSTALVPQRVDRPDEVEQAFLAAGGAAPAALGGSRTGGVVVEPVLEGQELTLACTVEDGRVRTWFSAERERALAASHESRQYVVVADRATDPELASFAQRVHAALGIRHGVTHINLVRTAEGPRVTRVGAWLAGDLVPLIGCMATGVDLAAASAHLALGDRVRERVEFRRAAGVRIVYPAAAVALARPGEDQVLEHGASTALVRTITEDEAEGTVPVGDLGALALLAASAADGPSCRAALDAAAAGHAPARAARTPVLEQPVREQPVPSDRFTR